MISHSSSGLIFADDFEAPPAPGDINASHSSWQGNGGAPLSQSTNSTDFVQVGSQSGKFVRGPGTGGRAEAIFSGGNETTGTIQAKFATYVPSGQPGSNDRFQIGFGTTLAGRIQFLADSAFSTMRSNDGATPSVDHGVPFVVDRWQNWIVNIDLDASTYDFTIDGVSSGTLGLRPNFDAGSTNDMTLMEVEAGINIPGGGEGYTFFLDSFVPEPSSLTLLGMMVGWCAAFLRRRQA